MALVRFRSWPRGRQLILACSCVAALLGALFWWRGERFYLRWLLESPNSGRCQSRLTRATLDRSIELGTDFLMAHQKLAGNFDYEYDWSTQQLSTDDHETRQAGALWGLTLLHQEDRRPELAAAIERSLAFFDDHSRLSKGVRCTVYTASGEPGRIGTIALVALAYIDYLRAAPELGAEQRARHDERLGQYLKMLLKSVHPNGLWYSDFEPKTCRAKGEPSSYADGEALLALVKAAKYLGREDLLPATMTAAAAGKKINIDDALAAEPDSDITKGYYQWSSMAFYELATSDFPDTRGYGDALLRLADWVIDEHKILTRTRNTGYAYEGIVHAYALAKQRGDSVRQAKYRCVIDLGLEHIIGWQVGGPIPNRYITASPHDRKALGGVQNAAFEAPLRVDVTQHQMHATLLARRYVY